MHARIDEAPDHDSSTAANAPAANLTAGAGDLDVPSMGSGESGEGEGGMGSNRVDAFFDTETWVLSMPRVVDGRCFDLHASVPVG